MDAPSRSRRVATRRGQPIRREAPLFPRPDSLVGIAVALLEQIDRREAFLPGAEFEDPQWLMTLELFVADEEGRAISVSSLCLASGVPPTTALRHIRSLEAKGIFERSSHPSDRRISHVRLSQAARTQVARYLASLRASGLVMNEEPPIRAAH